MPEKQTAHQKINSEIDRLIHEPVRLKILVYLSQVEGADFVFLVSRLGLTMGNLSAHISKLEEAGYVKVIKKFKKNRPNTMISITEKGLSAFNHYREEILHLLGEISEDI
jgi:DNA-binding MarR family transcriptional regulator